MLKVPNKCPTEPVFGDTPSSAGEDQRLSIARDSDGGLLV